MNNDIASHNRSGSRRLAGDGLYAVDWLYPVENGTIINRIQFDRYVIKVAELVAPMRPRERHDDGREAV